MIYDKLTVLFLSTIASEKKDSTNSIIASFILENIEKIRKNDYGIKEIASECHVGIASISRFCKDIGLDNFAELRELIMAEQNKKEEKNEKLSDKIKHSIDSVENSINTNKLNQLCRDLLNYKNSAAFGLLKASSAAISLETDMLMLGRKVYTNLSYKEQIKYINEAKDDTVIVIFSYTGAYFEYLGSENKELNLKRADRPKIWMVCGREDIGSVSKPEYVSDMLIFNSDFSYAGHPYQLLCAESLISEKLTELTQNSEK